MSFRSTSRRSIVSLAALAFLQACADDESPGGGAGQGGDVATGGDPQAGGAGHTSGGGGAGGAGGEAGGGGSTVAPCPDVTMCNAELPDVGAAREWNHTSSSLTAGSGFANHRGRDMFYNPGDTLWVMGKFAYGVLDDDIKDEDVDIYLNRGCGSSWELLSTEQTTDDGEHATVEGVEDTGGWIFYEVPAAVALEPGRHRFLLVVAGDLSTTELYLDIVEPGTPIIVSDVDGTLTTTENEEFTALLTGALPQSNPDSPAVLGALADKGYRIFYLTARPHFLGGRTREFLSTEAYPLGLVHTTLTFTGATGASAEAYKTAELAALADRGLVPGWAFGNTASDAGAYAASGVEPAEQRVMFQFSDDVYGSRRIEAYSELLPEIEASEPARCP